MKTFEVELIERTAELLRKGKIGTAGIPNKHKFHEINKSIEFVAKHIERNAQAISTLIFEDRNMYKEKCKHDQIAILNKFVDAKRKSLDLETYKNLKAAIGHFVNM